MHTVIEADEPAIVRGIKTVGIGKRGSRPLDLHLAREIAADIKANKVNPVAQGAFFAALVLKGIAPQEIVLEEAFSPGTLINPKRLVGAIITDAPEFVKEICVALLQGKTFDYESAYRLGKFLFSNDPGDEARGLIASALRVRYETADEYAGILKAMEDTFEPPFRRKIPRGEPVVQLAEPFDGVDHAYLITPLLADFIQNLGFRVVSLVGRNSGPKFGNNLRDLVKTLKINFILNNAELNKPKPDFGWFISQEHLSRPIDRWVDIRRQTIKRPFLSTLERFVNPAQAHIAVASAFHPPYTEKMVTVCELAGFPGAVIVRNGIEGTLACYLNRPFRLLCSARQCEGEYLRQEIEIAPQQAIHREIKVDEKLERPSLEENARLIQNYRKGGTSGQDLFDFRIQVCCAGFRKAIEWLKNHMAA